ncbi:MAG: hypothetical protein AAF667_09910 [Pseudomonadota bacterium]
MYQAANVVALTAGIGIQTATAATGASIGDILWKSLFGYPGATLMTISILVYMYAAHAYEQGSRGRARFHGFWLRRGDFAHASGTLLATSSIAVVGGHPLAIAGGLVLLTTKLVSAMLPRETALPKCQARLVSLLQITAAASRLPIVLALTWTLFGAGSSSLPPEQVLLTAAMLTSYVLGMIADLILGRSD